MNREMEEEHLDFSRKLVATKLGFPCTNNMAEYEACIASLKAVLDMNFKELVKYKGYLTKLYEAFPYVSSIAFRARKSVLRS